LVDPVAIAQAEKPSSRELSQAAKDEGTSVSAMKSMTMLDSQSVLRVC
jgi:hypothetical protein